MTLQEAKDLRQFLDIVIERSEARGVGPADEVDAFAEVKEEHADGGARIDALLEAARGEPPVEA